MTLVSAIHEELAELVAMRRDIHAHPELRFEEFRTADLVSRKLESWGIEVHRVAKTGIVGTLSSGGSGKAVALRSDLDALPMAERNPFLHRSVHPNRMHACGHDGHTVMLLGAAQYLAAHRTFSGTVHFFFQPAEEVGEGARAMLEEGLLENFPCDAIFGMHTSPDLPPGVLAFRTGPTLSSASTFDINVLGTGGHAARPHCTIDPIVVGTQLVQAFHTLISRSTNPLDAAVLSITEIHGGDAFNIIPNEVRIRGSVRTFSEAVLDRIESGMQRFVATLPPAFGATANMDFQRTFPVLVNWPEETEFALGVAEQMVGPHRVVRNCDQRMAADDFAIILQRKRGSFISIGNGDGSHREPYPGMGPCFNHNPSYDFNDEIIPVGASYWVKLVEAYLPANQIR